MFIAQCLYQVGWGNQNFYKITSTEAPQMDQKWPGKSWDFNKAQDPNKIAPHPHPRGNKTPPWNPSPFGEMFMTSAEQMDLRNKSIRMGVGFWRLPKWTNFPLWFYYFILFYYLYFYFIFIYFLMYILLFYSVYFII